MGSSQYPRVRLTARLQSVFGHITIAKELAVRAALCVVQELSNCHLAFVLVVNEPGMPKSLHVPVAALDSGWLM